MPVVYQELKDGRMSLILGITVLNASKEISARAWLCRSLITSSRSHWLPSCLLLLLVERVCGCENGHACRLIMVKMKSSMFRALDEFQRDLQSSEAMEVIHKARSLVKLQPLRSRCVENAR